MFAAMNYRASGKLCAAIYSFVTLTSLEKVNMGIIKYVSSISPVVFEMKWVNLK